MLRMGRSPKVEPREEERPQVRQTVIQPAGQQVVQQTPAVNTPPPQQPLQRAAQASPEPQTRPEQARPSAPRAFTETDALARELREGIMSGFVGSGTVLTGEADFKGMLRIDGRFTGHITSEKGTLIVSAGGRVEADIRVGTAKVNGVVDGDITASERIELGRSAQVRGNIRTPVLVVEQGAIFEGGCRMTQSKPETEKTQEKTQRAAEKVSAPRPSSSSAPRVATPQAPSAELSKAAV